MITINFVEINGEITCINYGDIKKVAPFTNEYLQFQIQINTYEDYTKICVFENKDKRMEEAVVLRDNVCFLPETFSGLYYFSVHFVFIKAKQRIVTNKEYFLLGG